MSAGIKAIVAINQAASSYKSSIVLRMKDKHVDVKSILGLSITLYTN
jgi:phosphocarrier protein HPr